jgi:hypothetical protein
VLISFNDVCVAISSGRAAVEGFGLTEYDPATNTLDSPVTVFRATKGQTMAAHYNRSADREGHVMAAVVPW